MEEWKDIQDYEGIYQVSTEGRVRSLDRIIIRMNGKPITINEKIIKQFMKNDKHMCVQLWKNGKYKHYQIHRLVADAFIPNPNNYDVVHHIDHNPKNNRVENLMWMDKGEHKGMHSSENRKKTVYQYTLDGKLVAIWGCAIECNKYGFIPSLISSCCRGERKTHKGFRWSYIPL